VLGGFFVTFYQNGVHANALTLLEQQKLIAVLEDPECSASVTDAEAFAEEFSEDLVGNIAPLICEGDAMEAKIFVDKFASWVSLLGEEVK